MHIYTVLYTLQSSLHYSTNANTNQLKQKALFVARGLLSDDTYEYYCMFYFFEGARTRSTNFEPLRTAKANIPAL